MEKDIIIRNIKVESKCDSIFGASHVASLEAMIDSQRLYFSVPEEFVEYLERDSYDAFFIAALPLALLTGRNIRIEGVLSEKLYYNVINDLIPILCIQRPEFRPVSVKCDGLRSTFYKDAKAVGCGFSGGIDSLCSIELNKMAPPSFKITHLFNINAGANSDNGLRYKQRYLERLATAYGIPLLNFDSNIHKVINLDHGRIDHSKIHTVRNLGSILALQKLVRKFIYSAGYAYQHCGVFQTDESSFADPIVLGLLSTEATEFISVGSRLTRVQKTEIVSEIPLSYECLHVCLRTCLVPPTTFDAPLNCGYCKKCLRTLLTLEILGKLERYSQVFDLGKYKAVRNSYIENHIIMLPDVFEKEIAEYAMDRKFAPIVKKLKGRNLVKLKIQLARFFAAR